MDELTLTLHHPLTDKEWDDIDDVECDGHCLMEEIEDLLGLWRLDDVDDT